MLVQTMQEKEIRWKTSFLPFFIYLCFFIFVTSCENGTITSIPELPDNSSDLTPGDISDRLIARIYFDATLSMQGFVIPGSTHYTQICPYLESAIVSGWKEGKADFFRFGERVETIDRHTYLKVRHADFYKEENIYQETFIQKIIDYEDRLVRNQESINHTPEESTEITTSVKEVNESSTEHRLVVIVTDLFQDNSDINLLVTQLKEKYIQSGLEIGLFGLRSQFDGTVYDIGIGQEPLRYKSNPGDPETFRPFYILVLGRHADIAHYFHRLKINNPDSKTIIFSQYLVTPLLSFHDATSIETNNLNKEISNKNIRDSRVKQFRIVDSSIAAEIFAKLKYVPLPQAMFFDSKRFEVSVTAKHAPKGATEISLEAQECLEVTPTFSRGEDDNELSVDFSLDSRSLPRGKVIYLYEVTLRPEIDTYRAPDWCSDWDMGDARDGSKTLNLVNFVRDLSQVTAREHRPKIAQFHCYIGKR